MRHPLTHEKVFAYYGLMLGSMPPISIFILFSLSNSNVAAPVAWLLMAITTFVSAVTGYSFGKVVGTMVRKNEDRKLAELTMRLIAIGVLWGAIAGGAGGLFLFVIGAFFGALIGGVVGGVALPAFAIPYLAVKSGGVIDLKHFLPLSLGITFTICAFILGLA